jgi:hypothetical protein
MFVPNNSTLVYEGLVIMQFFSKIVLEIFQQKDTNKKGGIVARRGEMRMEGNMGGR